LVLRARKKKNQKKKKKPGRFFGYVTEGSPEQRGSQGIPKTHLPHNGSSKGIDGERTEILKPKRKEAQRKNESKGGMKPIKSLLRKSQPLSDKKFH